MNASNNENIKIAAQNRKARHDYHIMETWEAGLVLQGTEVKSLRNGKANLKDSYAKVENGEVFLFNCHISPYEKGTHANHDPERKRKLLLNRKEIRKLTGKVEEKGLTLIALKIYFKRGKAKIELGLARGKKLYDRRADITKRDMQREVDRTMKQKKY
ncbi:SsrA-binding protein SmpB [candidate division KSB1 bacterium]|nr:SsrA-binding protein SmpB [candidate division KSB1 bacterium]